MFSRDPSYTPELSHTATRTGSSRSYVSDPAPLNSDQLPSCEMDGVSNPRGCGWGIETTEIMSIIRRSELRLFASAFKTRSQNRLILAGERMTGLRPGVADRSSATQSRFQRVNVRFASR